MYGLETEERSLKGAWLVEWEGCGGGCQTGEGNKWEE